MKSIKICSNVTLCLLLICLLSIFFYGCKKKDKSTPSTPRLQYMTYKVNGVYHNADFVDTSYDPGVIWISGFTISGANGNNVVLPTDAQIGTYDLNSNPNYGCSLVLNDSLVYFSKSGTTKLSSVGKTYEGTFEYVGVNLFNLNDSVIVTEGKFGFTF